MIYVVFYHYYEDSQNQLATDNFDKAILEYVKNYENDIEIWENEELLLSYGDLERHNHHDVDKIKLEIQVELQKIKGCGL